VTRRRPAAGVGSICGCGVGGCGGGSGSRGGGGMGMEGREGGREGGRIRLVPRKP
jgi:hypothetical protein